MFSPRASEIACRNSSGRRHGHAGPKVSARSIRAGNISPRRPAARRAGRGGHRKLGRMTRPPEGYVRGGEEGGYVSVAGPGVEGGAGGMGVMRVAGGWAPDTAGPEGGYAGARSGR